MASNYKRHSMPVVPRPLQLANGSTPSPSPLSASASYSIPPSPLAGSPRPGVQGWPPHKRRPSSIIYNPPTPTSRHARPLARSSSVGGERDRRTPTVERAPTTLAEKHADLLHFIAQKESKCLEMRSQLSVHEAELLQLKRKWERIVSRGFISPHNPSTPSLPSSNATVATAPSSNLAPTLSTPSSANTSLTSGSDLPTSANGAAVFDGVRAGVQGVRAGMEGVGRLIAASLPAVPFSPPAPSYFGPNAASPLRPEPPALQRSTSGKMHSARSSTSTNASSSTTSRFNSSTRLSQSSASSIEEETTPSLGETSSEQCDEDAWGSFADGDGEAGWTGGADHDDDPWGDLDVAEDDGGQILMVQDTGATPVVSPNPMFGARGASGRPANGGSPGRTGPSSDRVSRQREHTSDSSAEAEAEFFAAAALAGSTTITSGPYRTSTSNQKPQKPQTLASLVDGLASTNTVAPMSAWVGNVGKKWEELTGTPGFAKNSKRASLLFSDIALALQVTSPPSSPQAFPPPSKSPSPAPSARSLLDADNDFDAPALTPTLIPSATLQPTPKTPLSTRIRKEPGGNTGAAQALKQEEDDEWGW